MVLSLLVGPGFSLSHPVTGDAADDASKARSLSAKDVILIRLALSHASTPSSLMGKLKACALKWHLIRRNNRSLSGRCRFCYCDPCTPCNPVHEFHANRDTR